MTLLRCGVSLLMALTAATAMIDAQARPPAATAGNQAGLTVDGLVSVAKGAAQTDWQGTFTRLCIPPPPSNRAGGGTADARALPPRETWHVEPAKVADNLYFVGEKEHHSWALVGSEGIILIEALFDYMTADEVIGGMRKFGLDPLKVKYAIMSHAHADHDGGASYLQDSTPGMHLIYGAGDWDAIEKAQFHAGGKPKRDMVGTDGMTLSVGDASLQIVTMPGHTPGTLSYLFEVRDNGKPLRIAYVGGTAIAFDGTAAYYDQYLESSRKFAKAAADFGATALLSNHTEFDNGYYKAHTAANRKAGEPNPFDVGKDAVARYFQVVQTCTEATKMRATAAKK
ncbi:MAG: MBL fold metallo-hydrolase [Vicinamibacterales bacterium]